MAIAMPGSDQNPRASVFAGPIGEQRSAPRREFDERRTREAVDLRKSTFGRYDTGVGEGMTFAEFSQMRAEQRITQPPTIAIAPAPVGITTPPVPSPGHRAPPIPDTRMRIRGSDLADEWR